MVILALAEIQYHRRSQEITITDTHREKAPSIKTQALTKSIKWIVGKLVH